MVYCIPYILLLVFYGILSVYRYNNDEDEDIKRKVDVLCVLAFIFFFGLRGFVYDDWINYYPAFQRCSFDNVSLNIFEYNNEWVYEPGFTLLMCVCKAIVDDYQFLVFVTTTINALLLYNFFRNRIGNLPIGFILFICFGGLGMSTNLMRNSIAIMIFVNALTYIKERKPLPYFGLCLLAISFHVSAIAYFPLYFLFNRKCNKWVYLGLFVVSNLIFILRIPVFLSFVSMVLGDSEGRIQTMIGIYTSGNFDEMKTLSIGYLERLFTGILIFCYYEKLAGIRDENKMFINAFICYFLMTFVLSEFGTISLRMSYLFMFAYWILWYDLVKCFAIESNRKLFLGFMFIYLSLKTVGLSNLITAEYDNVLFGIKTYEERLYIHNRYATE